MSSIIAKPPDFSALCLKIEEARAAMSIAIEARRKPEIVHTFAGVRHSHAEAKASELYFEETKNAEAKRKVREARLGAECLMGQWLIELEEKKLRFMGRPGKGTKIGTPPDPRLITLEELGLDRKESQEFQAVARLTPEEFAALVADGTATSALLGRQVPEKRVLPLSAICVDPHVQPRVVVSMNRIADYVEDMRRGDKFPPLVVFEDTDKTYWLADGFHRYRAAFRLERENVESEVRKGGLREAILYACGANAAHGLRRTNGDKRQAVTRLLKDEEWSKWSDREIARRCNIGHDLVGKLREQLKSAHIGSTAPASTPPSLAETPVSNQPARSKERIYRTRHGTISTMQTENIGHHHAPEPIPSGEPTLFDQAQLLSPQSEQKIEATRSAGQAEPAPPDPWAKQRAAFYGFMLELKRVDLSQMFAATPLAKLQEAKDVVLALSAALDAAIERATPAEEQMSPAA